MTLYHADGFNHYGATSELWQIYQCDTQGNGGNPRLTTSADSGRGARTGSYFLNFQSDFVNNFAGRLRWTFPTFESKIILCMGLRHNRIANNSRDSGRDPYPENPLTIIMKDGSTVSVAFNYLQQYVIMVNNVVVAESNPRVFQLSTWNWIEMLVDLTARRVELRVNGAVVVTYSGAPVPAASPDVMCAQWYGQSGGSQDYDVADMVIVTGTAYPGDHRCFTLLPNANTAQAQWAVSGTTDAFDAINNIPNDPTQFIASHNANDVSTFNHDPLPDNALTVLGLAFYTKGKKSDAGDCNVAVGLTTGGQTALAPERPQVTTLTWNEDIVTTNPKTNAAYTPTDVNTGQLTIKRTL